MTPPELHILIVDDNRGDAVLLTRALKSVLSEAVIETSPSGEQALQRLLGEGEYSGKPLPVLVLLDCRLPRLSGFQVLEKVRTDPALKAVRILLMSGLVTPEHVAEGERCGSDGHIEKPDTPHAFDDLAQALRRFTMDASGRGGPFRFPDGLPHSL